MLDKQQTASAERARQPGGKAVRSQVPGFRQRGRARHRFRRPDRNFALLKRMQDRRTRRGQPQGRIETLERATELRHGHQRHGMRGTIVIAHRGLSRSHRIRKWSAARHDHNRSSLGRDRCQPVFDVWPCCVAAAQLHDGEASASPRPSTPGLARTVASSRPTCGSVSSSACIHRSPVRAATCFRPAVDTALASSWSYVASDD